MTLSWSCFLPFYVGKRAKLKQAATYWRRCVNAFLKRIISKTWSLLLKQSTGDHQGSYCGSFVTFGQVYAPGPYGEYVTPPPHAPQIIYTADGQPYPGAYPYHYQGKGLALTYLSTGGRPSLENKFPLLAGGYAAPGVNHVVIQERQRDNGGDVALGMLAGAATGLALGSLFSVF